MLLLLLLRLDAITSEQQQQQQISLGDARSYYLSTAKNEHGVVYAQSVAGVPMTPISWNQMLCPKTRAVEFRKVAKMSQAERATK